MTLDRNSSDNRTYRLITRWKNITDIVCSNRKEDKFDSGTQCDVIGGEGRVVIPVIDGAPGLAPKYAAQLLIIQGYKRYVIWFPTHSSPCLKQRTALNGKIYQMLFFHSNYGKNSFYLPHF
jgi:hypothetical protein